MVRLNLVSYSAIAFTLSLALAVPVRADPPPWAPAHGWRDKHGHHDEDDDDRPAPPAVIAPAAPVAVLPYGLSEGTCHRDLIGAALGAAAGGLVGSNIGKSSGRTAATVGGVLLGMFVGGAIGRQMDQLDQACTGQILEHMADGRSAAWQGQGGQTYQVTPIRSYQASGRYCREYQSRAVIGGRPQTLVGTACRNGDGSWQIVN